VSRLPKKYPEKEKQKMLSRLHLFINIATAAKSFGINKQTLSDWIRENAKKKKIHGI
jgi:transposase-like protein